MIQIRSRRIVQMIVQGVLVHTLLLSMTVTVSSQRSISDWSDPSLIFATNQGEKTNELWLLRDPSDALYLWWPVFRVKDQRAIEEGPVFHTVKTNERWAYPIDVMLWPDAGRLTSVIIDENGVLHAFSATNCVSQVKATWDISLSANAWGDQLCLEEVGNSNLMAARGQDGTLYVAYVSDSAQELLLITSSDGGNRWSSPSLISNVSSGLLSDPALTVDTKNRLHVVWTVVAPPQGYPPLGVFYSRSDDAGANWTAAQPIGLEDEGQAAITVFEDQVHVVWNGDAAKKGRFYRQSTDGGDNWGQIEAIIPSNAGSGGLQRAPALITDDTGALHMLIHDQERLLYVRKDGEEWTERQPMYQPEDMKSYEVYNVRLAITGGNQLHAIYTIDTYTDNLTENRDNHTYRIYHQFREIDAPVIEPKPWPDALNPATVAEINPSDSNPSTENVMTNATRSVIDFPTSPPSTEPSTPTALLFALVPSLIVVIGVILMYLVRSNNR